MDWRFVLFVAGQGIPGLLGLLATFPVFVLAASPGRKLRAVSATLAALAVFFAACLLAGLPDVQTSRLAGAFPVVGSLAVLSLLVPSIRALKWRWFGLLHAVTLFASAYLCFIGALGISHDAT
ncbi:hypothetical protein DX914_18470 [Lysobacter silvisoli]|uniref:Uncharacterized protein n=1 Tax=Lysobacter silvisoli TaxID=2293254 RepID=A0A371JX76_9GAMM|nr:hypothetical protein DX914_18470 [Lysobacter silvisoli]